jgi:pimeloyl-ACP methyl ester carboxylesterase
MAAKNRRANYFEIQNAGHLLPLEQPAAFTQAISDWLTHLKSTLKLEFDA